MTTQESDKVFAGSVPRFYDTYLVPLIFEPYAEDIARRVAALAPARVLEIAAGTGVVTRALASLLPRTTQIVATDLNQAMIDHASEMGAGDNVEWKQADALDLPFEDESFDAVVCQFGAMFFPDKPKAYSEVRRVLKKGGTFVFNIWDRIEENEFADVVTRSLEPLFPADPPRFLARTPHGHYDRTTIERDLSHAGFPAPVEFLTIAARSPAESAKIVAVAYCEGTPLRNEIEARDPSGLDRATSTATKAIESQYGSGVVDAKIQAHVIIVRKE